MSSKYNKYQYKQIKERRWVVHPVWRGIGLFFIIFIPIMSFAAAVLIVRQNMTEHWFQVPAELSRSFSTPALKILSPELNRIYYADFALTVVFLVLAFGIMTVFYSVLWRYIGPSRYGPVDSPPIRRSPHRQSK
jgi:hypothetical protein